MSSEFLYQRPKRTSPFRFRGSLAYREKLRVKGNICILGWTRTGPTRLFYYMRNMALTTCGWPGYSTRRLYAILEDAAPMNRKNLVFHRISLQDDFMRDKEDYCVI